MPSPSPSALVGLAVLVLIGVGAVHLSGAGSAIPLQTASPTAQEATPEETAAPADATPSAPTAQSPGATPTTTDDPAPELVVHVSGAVAAPGVVHLPAGARVDDALRAVGGATDEADLAAVNLARPLVDGEQIHVPVPGEEPRPHPVGPTDPAADGPAETAEGALIDLNTADAAELEELPGVGPAIARRILEHREKNGPFTSVDGLLEVSGIGPATLEEIRGRATV